MTEEQIKQNAEEYANSLRLSTENPPSNYHIGIYDGYLAGAHSRDEEIKELKEEIESLQEQYNTCFDGFKKRGTKLGELMKENVKLRNPWIGVKERLPKEGDEIILKRDYVSSYFRKVRAEDIRFIEYSEPNAKWMPIPQAQKV